MFAGPSARLVTMGGHLFCHYRSLMARTQRQASRLYLVLAWLGLHSARRLHCNVILAHSVIFIHLGGHRDRSVSRKATRCSIYREINLSSLLCNFIMSHKTMICCQNDIWIFATSTCNLENRNCTFLPFCAKNHWPTTQFLVHFIQSSLGRPTIGYLHDRP